ncbi:bifunctional cytidylyltransferase/SDR family oxidoreductase [Sinosporangium album]|uniref:bifunctional cytidylyltransferase/SDR family oxidoreductase n=1 Tax=Sinosporangium album TaxID=504805 RepID=UPI001C409123|nr:bifunctional cytidylyltransferase/SDR family oxidoreductase [Sinosporangium album]
MILAGGVGQRVGSSTPKQLIEIAGRPILEHTLALFDAAPEIDEIVVLMAPGFTGDVEALVERGGYRKVRRVVEGGASRTESTWRALQALGPQECDVLLHDAVRPLLEPRIITECVEALKTYSAVDVAIPSSDTILVAEPGPRGELIKDVPERSRLRRVQTPQCFRLSVIREAYERAFADPDFDKRPPTDDCGVVLRYLPDVPIYIVPGSEHNMKVTHPVDIHIAEKLFELFPVRAPRPSSQAVRDALAGRTIVVFGDGRGVDARIADLARGYGAEVFAFSRGRDDSHGRDSPGDPHGAPHGLYGVRVEDPRAVADALAHAAKETGRIDCVVNAAAVPYRGSLAEASDATVAETLGVNMLGPVNVAKAAFPHLKETRGHLLLCAAAPHARGRAEQSLQASSMAAVVRLTQALADEWAEYGVRVNCVDVEGGGASPLGRPSGAPAPGDVARTSLEVLATRLTGQVVAGASVDGADVDGADVDGAG